MVTPAKLPPAGRQVSAVSSGGYFQRPLELALYGAEILLVSEGAAGAGQLGREPAGRDALRRKLTDDGRGTL